MIDLALCILAIVTLLGAVGMLLRWLFLVAREVFWDHDGGGNPFQS